MKCVILAGGKGSRISELSKNVPKPMIKILGKPIIVKIMQHYSKFGFKDLIIAAGYKKKIIKEYFKKNKFKSWKINVVDTGLNTMTGGRIKRLKKLLENETFMLTYGDGVSNVNLKKLILFHNKQKKLITVTAVRPPARFGEIIIKKNKVLSFKEKPQVKEGWINGGYFVVNKKFLKYIKSDSTILEKEPLEKVVKQKQLCAFKHSGFWKCMDVKRDRDELLEIYKKNKFF